MSKYIISVFLLLSLTGFAQEQSPGENAEENAVQKSEDSVLYHESYGLRLGLSLDRIIYAFSGSGKKGFEIVGDYRFSKVLYIAGELGWSTTDSHTDYLKFNTKGSYIRMGVDYNLYKNWLGMQNMIYIGARYGFSNFSQNLSSYSIYAGTNYWGRPKIMNQPQQFQGLTAHWGELVIGIKAEILRNLYLGISISGKRLFSSREPQNFKNLYIPGFNRVSINNLGAGFNYTISYTIPLYKK